MSKQFWGVIIVILAVFGGIFAFSGNKSDSSTKNTNALTSHVEGKGSTGVTLVEYGDYQCPFCGQYYPIVKQVQTEFADKIFFQFRNFPLTSVHPNAFAGARAAEAAAMQNKFWEMHDLLYENQSVWSSTTDPTTMFKSYAQQLGLNAAQFQTDYASSKVNDLINADMAEGNRLGITGTPTFFIDGKKIEVSGSVANFEKLINAEIAKKGSASSAGSTAQTQGSATSSNSTSSGQ